MDFGSLLFVPISAIVTALVVIAAAVSTSFSEARSLSWGSAISLALNIILDQPWYYMTASALADGLIQTLLFTILGFCAGGICALALVRIGRWINRRRAA